MVDGPIDRVQQQWRQERPDLDTSSIAIFGRIDRLSKVTHAEGKKWLETLGISSWEYEVLATLRRSGPEYQLAPRQLSDALLVSGSALTNRLDHLERAGLVQRQPDPADRRGLRIKLTRKGQEQADGLVEAYLMRENELLEPLTARERRSLGGLLRKLLMALEPTTSA